MNEPSTGRKRARIKGRCLARRAEMKQQGFCLSGCPPLSFPQFTPAGWSPRCMNLAAPFNPFFSTSNSILRHPFGLPPLLLLSFYLLSRPPPSFLHPVTPFLHPQPPPPHYRVTQCKYVYTVCPHSLASYIFTSYNIDYFELRISPRGLDTLLVLDSRVA